MKPNVALKAMGRIGETDEGFLVHLKIRALFHSIGSLRGVEVSDRRKT